MSLMDSIMLRFGYVKAAKRHEQIADFATSEESWVPPPQGSAPLRAPTQPVAAAPPPLPPAPVTPPPIPTANVAAAPPAPVEPAPLPPVEPAPLPPVEPAPLPPVEPAAAAPAEEEDWEWTIAMARARARADEKPAKPVHANSEAAAPRRRLARGTDSRHHASGHRVPLVRSHNLQSSSSTLPRPPRALRSRRPGVN